jgi:hypothetical protein
MNILLSGYSRDAKFSQSDWKTTLHKVKLLVSIYFINQIYSTKKILLNKIKGTVHTINIMVDLIQHFRPLDETLENKLVTRLLSSLTQSKIDLEYDDLESLSSASTYFEDHVSGLDQVSNPKILSKKQYKQLRKILIDLPVFADDYSFREAKKSSVSNYLRTDIF